MVRSLLAILAVFDTLLGVGSILVPELLATIIWPGADPGGLVMIRRTGVIWVFFALAEWAALHRPDAPDRLRLVALLHLMDVPADAIWVAQAEGMNLFGQASLCAFPPINLALWFTFWRAASRLEPTSAGMMRPAMEETR
jgi:hypothetical protein